LEKFFFFDNNVNLSYWYDEAYLESITIANRFIAEIGGAIKKPDRITSIPPHAGIIKARSKILDKQTTLGVGEYTSASTPLKFRNYLVLSTNENLFPQFYVDNEFYVSKVIVVKQNKFQLGNPGQGYYFPYLKSSRFYINGVQIKPSVGDTALKR
jgi:hypothetical protein